MITRAALAQWNYHVGVTAVHDDNPLALYQASSSSMWMAEGGLEYAGKAVSIGYQGSYYRYDRIASLDALVSQAYLNLGSGSTTLGFGAEQRLSTRESLYDYFGLSTAFAQRFGCLGFSCTWQAAGRLYRFKELEERDQQTILSSLRSARSFQTGTTIIASAGVGYTAYSSQVDIDSLTVGRPTVWYTTGSLRIAQSLGQTTGLAVQYQERILNGETPGGFVTDEDGVSYATLDDPSLYAARTIGAELTQMMLDYRLKLQIGAYHIVRDYITQGSYLDELTYDPLAPRYDRYNTVWLHADYDLGSGDRNVTLQMGLQYSTNNSSSFWYSYDGSYLSLGARYDF
jgi:hypothetical protein